MPCVHFLFDKTRIPSPCFVIDEDKLRYNAGILHDLQERTGVKILLALKCFASWATFPLLSREKGHGPLWGACASSVDEARLAREEFGGEVHAFAAAWNKREMSELLNLADHIVFNSLSQWRSYAPAIEMHNKSCCPIRKIHCGLRLNPEHSEGAPDIYNPCAPGSRLGIRSHNLEGQDVTGIDGWHFHTLCEQNADALARTLKVVEKKFDPWLAKASWINMGGGHLITKQGYDLDLLCHCLASWRDRYHAQIYLEPGEAVALDAGWLVSTVLDIIEADMPVVILDVAVPCHMPDVMEMPYRPRVRYEYQNDSILAGEVDRDKWNCRLTGKSCLAGDVVGEYSFEQPLQVGSRVIFEDMAIYSIVKTTTFNGLRLPSIATCNEVDGRLNFRMLREFGYEDFKSRLS
ncbi:MAG: carboxynorspermidine decarboxylase [Desulfovibrio sp.]|nr:carboxynorspermidine decarboxylase [Desulfovibrio sp.]